MRRLIGACVIAGAVLAADGAWIYAKAGLAQLLLHRAWRRTLAGETGVKPWPWADMFPVAKISVRGETSMVLSGASGRTLAFGPGHLDGTAAPGSRGNCVLSAHRDTQFAILRDVRAGEVIRVETPDGRAHQYRVAATRVVDRRDTWILEPTATPSLTLITCYPFDAVVPGGPQRFVVFAEKVA